MHIRLILSSSAKYPSSIYIYIYIIKSGFDQAKKIMNQEKNGNWMQMSSSVKTYAIYV